MSIAVVPARPQLRHNHHPLSVRDAVVALVASRVIWRTIATTVGTLLSVVCGAIAGFSLWAIAARAVGLELLLPIACVVGATLARAGELLGGIVFDRAWRAGAPVGRDPA